jgi:hypothetical protein
MADDVLPLWGKVMFRLSVFVGMGLLATAFLVGSGASQEKKEKTKTSYTPTGWKGLGLTKEQTADFAKIYNVYGPKLKALEEQIQDLRAKEKQEMVKLLTADQKDKLRKLVLPDEGDTKETTSDKKKGK